LISVLPEKTTKSINNLLWLFFKVKWFSIREAMQIRRCFPGFIPYEKAFKRAYRFHNPFRICKEFLRQRGELEVDAYGETPLPVFAQIAHECALSSNDTILELGCGRGRGVFFLSYLLGCRAIGIDWIPFFIQTAKRIAGSIVPAMPVSFACETIDSVDFSNVSAIYLYGTCLADQEILRLIPMFRATAAKIITVSYPLSDYSSEFCTIKHFPALFPWGEAEIYLNKNILMS
jgi:SAM-dependent methyltransferase